MYIYICMYIYTYMYTYNIHVYTYIYTHLHNHTHTHTHTHTHAVTWASPCVRHRVVKEHKSNCSTTAYNSSHGQISDDSCPSRDNFFCVLQYVAVCCSMLPSAAVSGMQLLTRKKISDDSCPSRDSFFNMLQCVAVCCRVLQ